MPTHTDQLLTPLYDWHGAKGARMVDFAGWSMPVQYTSIVEEHLATRNALGLFDVSHMGRLRFGGAGAAEFLDHLLTRRVTDLEPGEIRYALVCQESGGVLDDVLVYRLPPEMPGNATHQLVVNASNREKISSWIARHLPESDVWVEDVTRETGMIAVQGPLALEVVTPLLDVNLPAIAYYRGAMGNLAGRACLVSRTGYTGEDGCELIIAAEDAAAVWEIVLGAGQGGGAVPAGLGARDTLRLEAAMPLYGHELNEQIDPLQAGLKFACNLDGRDFVGSEALRQRASAGNGPHRLGLKLDGRRPARQGHAVWCQGEKIGEVTSGTFSPTLNYPIAMAYVQRKLAIASEVEIDVRGKPERAEVVRLPFYKRPRGSGNGGKH